MSSGDWPVPGRVLSTPEAVGVQHFKPRSLTGLPGPCSPAHPPSSRLGLEGRGCFGWGGGGRRELGAWVAWIPAWLYPPTALWPGPNHFPSGAWFPGVSQSDRCDHSSLMRPRGAPGRRERPEVSVEPPSPGPRRTGLRSPPPAPGEVAEPLSGCQPGGRRPGAGFD